jgi:hypothetical protein
MHSFNSPNQAFYLPLPTLGLTALPPRSCYAPSPPASSVRRCFVLSLPVAIAYLMTTRTIFELRIHFATGPSSHEPSPRRLSDRPPSIYDMSPYRSLASSIIPDRRSWKQRHWKRKWRTVSTRSQQSHAGLSSMFSFAKKPRSLERPVRSCASIWTFSIAASPLVS